MSRILFGHSDGAFRDDASSSSQRSLIFQATNKFEIAADILYLVTNEITRPLLLFVLVGHFH